MTRTMLNKPNRKENSDFISKTRFDLMKINPILAPPPCFAYSPSSAV